MDTPSTVNEKITEQVSRAMMPHMLSVQTQLKDVTDRILIAAAEDGSYENSPKLKQLARRLEQVINDYPNVLEMAILNYGLEGGVDQGLQYLPIKVVADEVVDVLADVRMKAAARVNTSVEMAANEAMNSLAALSPMMHPDTIRPIIISAVLAGNEGSSYGLAGPTR